VEEEPDLDTPWAGCVVTLDEPVPEDEGEPSYRVIVVGQESSAQHLLAVTLRTVADRLDGTSDFATETDEEWV
jgi:hypothetical protein